jgi:hypothetical protein
MKNLQKHDERIAVLHFGSVYNAYLLKLEKKNRTENELLEVIHWLTGLDEKSVKEKIKSNLTLRDFFKEVKLNPKSKYITGSICGYKIEEIKTPLTKKVRYLDKLVDELAKGKSIEKVLRVEK